MLPNHHCEDCGNTEPSTSARWDDYRGQSISQDINTGLGVAPTEGVDTGPHYRRTLINGLGVAPTEGVGTGPHYGSSCFQRGFGTAHGGVGTGSEGIAGISNHGCKGDRCRGGRMAGREGGDTDRPAAAATLGSA